MILKISWCGENVSGRGQCTYRSVNLVALLCIGMFPEPYTCAPPKMADVACKSPAAAVATPNTASHSEQNDLLTKQT